MEFQGLDSRRIEVDFEGGHVTSDAGALLLRQVENRLGIGHRLALCFHDGRERSRVAHTVEQLILQRIMGLCLGWEDLVDHDHLRHDPLMGLLAGKARPEAEPVAGKSTLNRLELSPDLPLHQAHRYHKITADFAAIDRLLVEIFLEAHEAAPKEIFLDLDATDDPVHGDQEGRFFHGYYGGYCYLPLYIFCGGHLLCARLRPSNIDAAAGWQQELPRIVDQIRQRWSQTRIVVRADSGFCRQELLSWCEEQPGVEYVIGLARNSRLESELAPAMDRAKLLHAQTRMAARVFHRFSYQTQKSWSQPRLVIGKAEWLDKGANPRFIVTSMIDANAQSLYEQVYCARGEAENKIKEQQLDLFADRTSTGFLKSNQLRLYLSSFAYVMMSGLRRTALAATSMARASCGSIRLRLLKAGALVKFSVRRILIRFSTGWPGRGIFEQAAKALFRMRRYG
jgi:hypothetical protein